MYLQAISIGYAVPTEDFDASVHSAFQSALNLRLNGEHNLLAVMASSKGDLPQGIRLDAPEGFLFEGFPAGEPVICRDGMLQFQKNSLTVQLSGARYWKCDLPALKIDRTNPSVSAAWNLVWQLLNKRQRLYKSEIIAEELLGSSEFAKAGVPRTASKAMQSLVRGTRDFDLTDIPVRELIGLGSGLTPAGDDLLVGYLAGLWCAVRDRSERVHFISGLGEKVIGLSSRTNDISSTYLYHATQGQVSSRLANLAEGICRGENPERLGGLAEAAMKVGHTSGMDTVAGMLAGLTAWESYE